MFSNGVRWLIPGAMCQLWACQPLFKIAYNFRTEDIVHRGAVEPTEPTDATPEDQTICSCVTDHAHRNGKMMLLGLAIDFLEEQPRLQRHSARLRNDRYIWRRQSCSEKVDW